MRAFFDRFGGVVSIFQDLVMGFRLGVSGQDFGLRRYFFLVFRVCVFLLA